MSTARQINPSYKPLPALPISNSGTSDLQLDSISIGHIRKLLQQSLYNCAVGSDPWESIILGIIFDVSDTVPKAVEALYQREMMKNEIISSQKKNDEIIDDKSNKKKEKKDEKDNNKDNKDEKDNKEDDIKPVDNQEKFKNDTKFIIKLKKEESGRISDSHFVYNYFDGENLFSYESDKESEPSKDEMSNWIGGTIIIKGSKKYANRIDNILELMVYVVCNLRLEVCLFRDYCVSRVDSKDNHDAEDVQNTLRNSRRTSKSSWLGWLMKHKSNVSSIKEHMMIKSSNEKIEKHDKLEKHDKPEKHDKLEKHDKQERHDKLEKHNLLLRRLSTKRSSISKSSTFSSSISISSTSTNTDDDDEVINLNTNKFGNAIRKMEKTILSISPGVKFPPPHLLMRLREEEKEIRLHTNLDGTFKSYMARDALDLANEFSDVSVTSTGKYRTYAAISRSNQFSLDFRSGLAYLMTNNNSLNGVFKHQSLSCSYSRFWSPTSKSPCHNHRIITLEYYNKYNDHVDKSLGEMINWLCDKAHEVCQDASCDHPGIDHITTYTHNTGRINIILEEASDLKLKAPSNAILMWTECKVCSTKTPIVQMSHATYFYSFGKYLELLFYNEDFYYKNLCQHSESRESVVRYFRRDNLAVRIEYEPVDLFEIRLPKLQISQEEVPISHNLGEAEKIDKLFIIDSEDSDRLFNETRLEITYVYGVVKQHITALEEYFDSLAAHRKETSTSGWVDVDTGEEKQAYNYLEMLDEMLKDFRKEEFELYDILKKSKATVLNEVRKLLVKRIKSTKKRLSDWQKKYVRDEDLEKFSNIDLGEPEYANSSKCHVFPGSPIIIREDEPTSIIALALSSRDYLKELSLMRQNVRLSMSQSAPTTPTSELHQQPQISSSFSSLISSLKSPPLQDPINDGDDFMDHYSLSIRRKLVKESPGNGLGDKISHGIESLGINPFNLSLSGKDRKRDPEKEGEKLISSKSTGKFGAIFGPKNENSEKPKDENIENEKQEVFNEKLPLNNDKNDKEEKKPQTIADPEKAAIEEDQKQSSNEKESQKKKDDVITASPVSFVRDFSWSRKSPKDSPHLKYQGIHGNKKFSCTIYHATEFDSLRRRCGIENICIESLSRCDPWKVTGGKSASTFFKAKDGRLVVKQMVSSWRTGEKEALLKFAPKYFKYMSKPPSKPSVLAKIFGFYTIKIKDIKKNNVILKMDVLVMEHLFFEKTITRTFDLKGIQERHTRDQTQDNATLWDGDWVEGRYKTLLLIHSHSKKLIREAIHNDTQFLADSNIMDYSLLVGVDDEKKELVVGIVDFIGTYTWYKKIENRGKTIGRNPKEVTVIPPDQYKDRFRNSIDQYFSAVPDKWIKSPTTDDNPFSPEEPPQSPQSPTSSTQPINLKLPSVL